MTSPSGENRGGTPAGERARKRRAAQAALSLVRPARRLRAGHETLRLPAFRFLLSCRKRVEKRPFAVRSFVIASEAKQSSPAATSGLLRRFAPRNDALFERADQKTRGQNAPRERDVCAGIGRRAWNAIAGHALILHMNAALPRRAKTVEADMTCKRFTGRLALNAAISAAIAGALLAGGSGAFAQSAAGKPSSSPPPVNTQPIPQSAPTYNPTSPNTMPQSPETPVSPSSPGSVLDSPSGSSSSGAAAK